MIDKDWRNCEICKHHIYTDENSCWIDGKHYHNFCLKLRKLNKEKKMSKTKTELKDEIEKLEKSIETNLQLQKILLNDLRKVSKELK